MEYKEIIIKIKELPLLKSQLDETKQLLDKAGSVTANVSADRLASLKSGYQNKIINLEEKIKTLTELAQNSLDELTLKLETLKEKKELLEQEFNVTTLLKDNQAITEKEYKTKQSEYNRNKREIENREKKLLKELDEINFYLTQKGDVNYNKQKILHIFDKAKGVLTQITNKLSRFLKHKYFKLTMSIQAILILAFIVITKADSILDYINGIKKTNNYGLVTFTDKKTDIEIKLFVTSEHNIALEGIKVKQDTVNGYNLFFAYDKDGKYFPSVKFYFKENNNQIVMKEIEEKAVEIEEINNENELSALINWVVAKGYISQNTYKKTFVVEQLGELGQDKIGFNYFFINTYTGLKVILIKTVKPFSLNNNNLVLDENLKDIITQRDMKWDIYTPADKEFFNKTFYLPSNKPEIVSVKKEKVGEKYNISWNLQDGTKYFNEIADPTVLLGGTSNPDLQMQYRIISKSGNPISNWQSVKNNSILFGEQDAVANRIELRVIDEVENQTERRVSFSNDVAMFRANLQHTGVYNTKGVPEFHRVKWKFKTNGKILSSPTISDGVAYLSSDDHYFYAIDILTGREKWKFETDGEIDSSPAISEKVAYLGSYDQYFYAIDIESGQEKWKFKTNGGITSSPAISDGVVYFGSYDNYLYALDTETGQLKWKFETGDGLYSSPAISDGVVYFGSYDNNLYALDAETGQLKWRFETGDDINSSPAILDGVVYFGSGDSYLYALNVETGQEKWKFKAGGGVYSSPAISDGVVYIGSDYGYLYVLDTETGQEKWKFMTNGRAFSSPVISKGAVYFCCNDGYRYSDEGCIYVVNIETRQEKWKFKTNTSIGHGSSPAIAAGIIYFGTTEGYLYALE